MVVAVLSWPIDFPWFEYRKSSEYRKEVNGMQNTAHEAKGPSKDKWPDVLALSCSLELACISLHEHRAWVGLIQLSDAQTYCPKVHRRGDSYSWLLQVHDMTVIIKQPEAELTLSISSKEGREESIPQS